MRYVVAVGALVCLVACGGDDDDEAPSQSLLDEVQAGLCSGGESSVAVGGTVFSLEDCP
jgi:hypothetical protein